jgi:hypothetical protein
METITSGPLLDRLSGLVSRAEAGEEADLGAIVGTVQEIRQVVAPTGALHATRAQATKRQQIAALFSETSRHLNDYHYNGKDNRHLRDALTKVQAACSLEDAASAAPDEVKAENGASYEVLGSLLIVGFW